MEQKTISPKEQRALDKVKRANAELAKVRRDQKKQLRKDQDHHKFMMGGAVAKYFPNGLSAYDFDELEMNRIIVVILAIPGQRSCNIRTGFLKYPDKMLASVKPVS